jgi:hypoxanthine phosphoribosyltransferase
VSTHDILFPADEIARRVRTLAHDIAKGPRPQIVVPVLAGAFVFAADLVRALADEGLSLPIEFLWLRSYGDKRSGSDVRTLVGPGEAARGRAVLLIDGVLDKGATLAHASTLLREAGALSVMTAVVGDTRLPEALLKADHAAFADVHDFIIGYGMDDAGMSRALPYIGKVT